MNKIYFYAWTEEDGWGEPFSTYAEALREVEYIGYGQVIVEINGVDFKITPWK